MSSEASSIEYRNLRALGDNAPFARHNHVMGVTAGGFAGLAADFLQPEMILVGLIYAVTKSAVLASVVPVINKLGVMAPQLLAGSIVEHLPRRRPAFVITTIMRVLLLTLLVGSIWYLTFGVTTAGLVMFFAAYLGFCISSAFAQLIFMDMIGRLIPAHRVGSFLGMRGFLGGAGSIIAGFLVIQPILQGVPTPMNYVILAAIGTVLVAIDMSLWSMTKELPGVSAPRRTGVLQAIRRGIYWLRTDRNYRWYAWSRVAFRVNYLGLAFFIPYGTERLGYELNGGGLAVLGGVLVGIRKITEVAGSAVWGRVVDRTGSRRTMVYAAALLLGAVLLALAAPELPKVFAARVPMLEQEITLPLSVYILALAVFGLSIKGTMIGGQRFLITSAPPHRRPSYLAFLNTMTTPLTLLPLAAACLAEAFGMVWIFAVVAVGAVLGLISVSRMEPDGPADAGEGSAPEPAEDE